MQRVLREVDPRDFRSPAVIARAEAGHIALSKAGGLPPRTFDEIQSLRRPLPTEQVRSALGSAGFLLANLGVSIALELRTSEEERFAVFVRRNESKSALSLLSGYWDTSVDATPLECARRELGEEFVIRDDTTGTLVAALGWTPLYPECAYSRAVEWTLELDNRAPTWAPCARARCRGLADAFVYFEPASASAQVLYRGVCHIDLEPSWSLVHVEDQLVDGKLRSTVSEGGIVLLRIVEDRLTAPPLQLRNGVISRVPQPASFSLPLALSSVDALGLPVSDQRLLIE